MTSIRKKQNTYYWDNKRHISTQQNMTDTTFIDQLKSTFLFTIPTVQIQLYSSLNRSSDDHKHHNLFEI